MKLRELYSTGKNILQQSNIPNYEFDAFELLTFVFNFDKQQYLLNLNIEVSTDQSQKYLECVERRAAREPLQYILEKWEFMGYPFVVGKGVLIPREDTQTVVNATLRNIPDKTATLHVLDLCSGSGIIAIVLAKNLPNATITALEQDSKAFEYLNKNIGLNKAHNVKPVQYDMLTDYIKFVDNSFDIIISNPPYIKSTILKNLEQEVKTEPQKALDGGIDGLKFYKNISLHWTQKLKPNGLLALEIGFDQLDDVSNIFSQNKKIVKIEDVKDFNGLNRAIILQKSDK